MIRSIGIGELGGEGSSVECWVDDNCGGARVIENAADVGELTPSYVFLPLSLPRTPDNTDRGQILENGGPWAPRVDVFFRFLPHIWVDGVPDIEDPP